MNRALVLFSRALRLRCPACGAGRLFASWFTMRARCPICELALEREEGYFLGAMLINLVVAELLFAAGLVLVIVATWPTPPWDALWIGSIAGMILAPLALYPFSKTTWLALDLLVRPVQPEETDRARDRSQDPGHSLPRW